MWKPSVMVLSNLVKEEIDEELSEVKASEKFLHNKVSKLEKRNRKLEKKVTKLKAQKRQLKKELAKFRGHKQSPQVLEVLNEGGGEDADRDVEENDGEADHHQHKVYH